MKDLIEGKKFKVEYVDSVIILEEPKIAPFKESMKTEISKALGVDKDSVSIKATTQEGIGAIGRGEAIAAYAVVTLRTPKKK